MIDRTDLTAGWYVIRTKPRQEAVALENLERQHFKCYLPFIAVNRRRKGKWIEEIEPLFPRYLFLQLEGNEDISPIRSTRGITELLRIDGKPARVSDQVVQFLIANERADSRVQNIETPVFQENEQVQVLDGPFSGLPAVFKIEAGEERALVLINLLGRESEIMISKDHLGRL